MITHIHAAHRVRLEQLRSSPAVCQLSSTAVSITIITAVCHCLSIRLSLFLWLLLTLNKSTLKNIYTELSGLYVEVIIGVIGYVCCLRVSQTISWVLLLMSRVENHLSTY